MKKYLLFILLFLFTLTIASCDFSFDHTPIDKDDEVIEDNDEKDPIFIDPGIHIIGELGEDPKPIEGAEVKETTNLRKLSKVEYPSQDKISQVVDQNLTKALNNFTDKVIKEAFDDGNNIFSPASLYMALSMLVEGISDEDCFNELLSLLGLDIKTLEDEVKKAFETDYYSNQFGRVYFANSIWIQNGLEVSETYVNTLKDKFYVESFQVNFSSRDVKQAIVDWINHYTENLLHLDLNSYEVSDDLALLLINTLYFNNSWSTEYYKGATSKRDFYLDETNVVSVDMMAHTISTYYYICDEYTIVMDNFANFNTITYIMPNDYNLTNVLNKGVNSYLDVKLTYDRVLLRTPKFEAQKHYDLKDALQNLGVNKIFEKGNYFQNIAQNLYVDYVIQDAGIKVTEEGVEAAAVTSIGMKVTSAGPTPDPIEISLDKPFIYIIRDGNNLPLFVGSVVNPNKGE